MLRLCLIMGRGQKRKGGGNNESKHKSAMSSLPPFGSKAFLKREAVFFASLPFGEAEKQKVKALYGLSEHHLKRYFNEARRYREETDVALWQILESRLDNVLFRLGFAPNRRTARQLINHKKVFVDGKRVTIPSYRVKPGQLVSLDKKALEIPQVNKAVEENSPLPSWLKKKALVGKVVKLPSKEDIKEDIDVALIIEFYSR